ncbi:MAG: cytochrome c biogenesis protein CcdA [Deltaproteobacteria bacterium]|nr:cytochrome c biogenesis protein CcdA [Deltaproteobacteria bacterium]MBW2150205.1 cytochrome c biogenesis protein CcdA [Deltaproteobacteria bacterium]
MTELQIVLTNWMTAISLLLPFGYSFGAGMVSTVNPCGFFMLPAYLSLYLGDPYEGSGSRHRLLIAGARAILLGIAVTLGFTVLFSLFGIIIWAGGYILMQYLPWLGLLVGSVLVGLGLFLFSGRSIHTALPARLANMIGTPKTQGFRTYFLFGIGYGTASLGCTLPVFFVVVGSAMKSRGFSDGVFQFISYSLGMGTVLTSLALSIAIFKGGLANRLRRVVPYMGRVAGFLLVVSGAYQIYYWLTKGGLLTHI